jgi:Putative beta-barrel porin 2
MKTIILAAGFAVVTGSALASTPVGRGEISATIAATGIYDSNVFGTPDAIADYSGTLAPRLSYTRKAGEIEAAADAGISFIRYVDQTQLDANNVDADATLRMTESNTRNYYGTATAAYHEASDLNTDVDTRVELKTASLTGQLSMITGPRSDAGVTGSYIDTRPSVGSNQQILTTEALWDYKNVLEYYSLRVLGDYDELHSSGNNTLGVPLAENSYMLSAGLGRALAHNTLRAGISYGYRILNRSAAEAGPDNRRQAGSVISASLAGPFLPEKYFPKVTSEFTLSYQDSATPGINDSGNSKELTGSLSLAWQARPNTSASFAVHRSQRLAVSDFSVVTTSVLLGLSQVLRYNLTGTLSAGYDWSTFRGLNRQDEIASFSAALKYHFARTWDANLSYGYTSLTSSLPHTDYNRHVVSLGVTHEF